MSLYPRPTFGRQFSESDATDGITTDTQLSNKTAAQGQSQLSVNPVGSAAARFQIRSANTLQYRPIRHIQEDKSQEAGDKSNADVKSFYESNKSKSLDWRGAGARRGHGNATWTSSGPRDSGHNFVRRAESLGKKEDNNNITSYTEASQPNSISWRSHDYPNSVSTSVGTNRIMLAMEQTGSGQSLPTRMKPRRSQGSIGEASSFWAQLPHDETSPDQTDNKIGVWGREQGHSNTEEVTGNQTILERIEKLLGASSLHNKSDANSKDLVIDKRNPTPDSGYLNSDTITPFRQRKSNPNSPSGPLSPTDNQQWRPSYTVEKSGTFPRWFSKSEQTPYNKMQEPSTPEIRNDQKSDSSGLFFSKPKWGMEISSGKNIQSLLSKSEQTPYNKMQEPSTPEIRNDENGDSSGVFLSKPKRGMEISSGKNIQSLLSKSEQTPYNKMQEPSTLEIRNDQKVDSSGVFFSKPKWGMEISSGKNIQSLLSKSEQTPYNKMQDPSTLEIRNDQKVDSSGVFFSKPKWEISPGKNVQSFPPAVSEEPSKMSSLEFNSQSIERTRSKAFETAQPSGQRTPAQMILQSTCSDGISNQSVKQLPTPSGGIKKEIEKEEPTQPKHPLASRGAPHGEIHQEDSSAEKSEEKGGDEETISSPTLDSVKNTIHKFEALAQQSQKAPQIIRARRALSVPEQPKPVVHVRKSDSDINLKFRNIMGNKESVKANPIEEPEGNLDLNRTHQSNLTVKVQPTSEQRLTYKTSIDLIPTFSQLHEPKPDQHISTWDTNKRWTVRNRHIDEPDLTITHGTGLQRSNTDSQLSKVSRFLKQQSFHVNMDDNNDEFDNDDTPTNSPDRDPLTVNMQGQNSTLKPQTSARTLERSDVGASISVKSADNGTYPKVVNPSQSSASTVPAPTIYSSFNNSNNNNYNTALKDVGPTLTSMARWSSDEEDYDDDEDYGGTDSEDSDSGESSVTITSNMSQSDRRSFSLSLQELCIFGGVDYKPSDDEDWAPSRSASLSSDISAFSSVTLLSNNELDRLMDDVKNLGDETLQKYEDVQVVVLHKEVGSGLGFTLAGGVDQNKPVTVHRVIPGGVAAQEGSIFEGAWVLSINGTPLQKSAHWEALRTLRKARSQTMAVVVLQNVNQNETLHTPVNTGRRVHVTLNKSSYDLGFSLEGGLDSSLGDKPLTVQKIFQGGPVSQVFLGDELLEVQGQSLIGMRRIEAWNLIRRLPPGPVEVLLHRPHQPH